MRLDNYFTFQSPDHIQIKGSNVGIESILYDHLYRSQTPEAIAFQHPSIMLEDVYATITYYYHNQSAIRAYLDRCLERETARREQLAPPRNVNRFQRVLEKREAERFPVVLNLAS